MQEAHPEEAGDKVHAGLGILVFIPVLVAVRLAAVGLSGWVVAAGVVDEIGWVRRHEHRLLLAEEPRHVFLTGRVTAEQPMVPEEPEVARLGNGRALGGFG